MVASTCLLMAAKFIDRKLPPLTELVKVHHGQASADDFAQLELHIVNRLQWRLHAPLPHSFVDKLRALGCGPDEATLVFTGVVTNRCVSSTLLHGVEHGYEAELLEGGCCAADAEQHAQGIALVREKGSGAVIIKP